ncbi:MAG: nickel-responsive transcriptional regulator NikR [Thermoplasmata archaeon]|jgi:CopG family nickel-responsive transcriptional regulator|nr:nickel-responsive transcriptional regulator NikR [Thermoplasmata archaeon]
MTRKVVRTAVSLEPELLALLDRWVAERNSPSRSDAIRALIRKELADRTLSDPDSDALGVVTLLYRHDAPNVMQRLTSAEHRWGEHVRSTSHVHLEGDACAEVVVLLGRRREVEAAAQDLSGVRGVMEGESVILTPSIAGGQTGHHHPHASVDPPHSPTPPRSSSERGASRVRAEAP